MNPYADVLKKSPEMATSSAIQAGADPEALAKAKAELGKDEYVGYCEKFVEEATLGHSGIYPSASDAWQSQQDKAVSGLQGVQPGDAVYFNDPSNSDGHVGLMDKGNKFVSATDNGIQENDINDWMRLTGQQALGYVPQKTNPYTQIMKGASN